MSTVIYLVCESHEPNIFSDEVGHHIRDLPKIRSHIKYRESIVSMMTRLEGFVETGSHTEDVTYRFLYHHPNCDLRIEDEYKRVYPLVDPGEEDENVSMNTSLGRVTSVSKDDEGMIVWLGELTDEGKRVLRLMGWSE